MTIPESTMSLLTEANLLFEAASHASDDDREEKLIQWTKEIVLPLADQGEPEAKWLLAECKALSEGEGLSLSESRARKYKCLQDAADAGSRNAQFSLSILLFDAGNFEKSRELVAMAADGGHPYAKWCYGLDLISGTGGSRDEVLALRNIEEAAELGFEGAIKFMADMYALGQYGRQIDSEKSAAWLRRLTSIKTISY